MRLIDADALIEVYKDSPYRYSTKQACATVEDIYSMLIYELDHRAPSIDAVEVVRCKDCQYGKEINGRKLRCTSFSAKLFSEVDRNHFCSYGKRKNDKLMRYNDEIY